MIRAPRFDDDLRAMIDRNLNRHVRDAFDDEELKHAAVAVAVVADDHGNACFVLTRRTPTLRSHAGQWALPGGRVDHGETARSAALRELTEELGVRGADVLGLLDDYPTRSGYRITPVVCWAPEVDEIHPNPAEVAAAYRVPFGELLRPDSPRFTHHPDVDGPILQIPIYDRLVHAPTAAVLFQFREVALRGNSTRVAHVEQPPFAWR